jgi:hypothetical protein
MATTGMKRAGKAWGKTLETWEISTGFPEDFWRCLSRLKLRLGEMSVSFKA